MEEVVFHGKQWIGANNSKWIVEHEGPMVNHVTTQSFDHCMLVLDTKLTLNKNRKRFIFYKR